MLSTVFFNQSLNSTLIEALMVSTSNYEMRGSLFLGIDASFNLKFRIAQINGLKVKLFCIVIVVRINEIGCCRLSLHPIFVYNF